MGNFSKILAITGPTATGKTALAAALAAEFDGEIISVDSRQVYRGMDIGTGKDLDEYTVGPRRVPYHLIDVVEPTVRWDLFTYLAHAEAALGDIGGRGKLPVLAGGSTLYFDALLRDYGLPGPAPEAAERERLNALTLAELLVELDRLAPENLADFHGRDNPQRVRRAIEMARATGVLPPGGAPLPRRKNVLTLGVYYPRAVVHERIAARLDARLDAGLIDEVRGLMTVKGLTVTELDWFGLEYRYVARYLDGQMSRADMRDELLAHIRQFAKRQDIWFRKMEREGMVIHWLKGGDFELARRLVGDFLAGRPLPEPELKMSEIFYGAKSS